MAVDRKYTFQDLDKMIKQLKDLKISIDSLPNEIKKHQNELTQILIIPTFDEESCCGGGCSPCVQESIVENQIRYNEMIESLLNKLNKF
jgi:hypothetical protein